MARTHDPYYDQKVYHFAAQMTADGEVSALCYKRPHAIDLTRGQSWVLVAKNVTCGRCRRALRAQVSNGVEAYE